MWKLKVLQSLGDAYSRVETLFFFFGCVLSSLLVKGFLLVEKQALLSSCCEQASHCSGLSYGASQGAQG